MEHITPWNKAKQQQPAELVPTREESDLLWEKAQRSYVWRIGVAQWLGVLLLVIYWFSGENIDELSNREFFDRLENGWKIGGLLGLYLGRINPAGTYWMLEMGVGLIIASVIVRFAYLRRRVMRLENRLEMQVMEDH